MNPALSSLGWIVAASAVALILGLILALDERSEPQRCGAGLVTFGPACCAQGQRFEKGACRGRPRQCPKHMRLTEDGAACVAVNSRVLVPAGRLTIGPNDWEAEGVVRSRTFEVDRFELDAFEVSVARWQRCVTARVCAELPKALPPGLPVTSVSPKAAERFCEFSGGRLPTAEEWIFAAAGVQGRRYPWGQAGLVCRRAVWGVVSGPCAQGASSPTLVGSRPSGRTERGLYDMAGNVAEWTVEGKAGFAARGGSFRSRAARELKSWSREEGHKPSAYVGFRCAYDLSGDEAKSKE